MTSETQTWLDEHYPLPPARQREVELERARIARENAEYDLAQFRRTARNARRRVVYAARKAGIKLCKAERAILAAPPMFTFDFRAALATAITEHLDSAIESEQERLERHVARRRHLWGTAGYSAVCDLLGATARAQARDLGRRGLPEYAEAWTRIAQGYRGLNHAAWS